MRKPLCIKCQTQFRNIESGITVVTMDGSNQPYELIRADLLECPGCKTQIVAGYAKDTYARHYQDKFQEHLHRAQHPVRDFEHPQPTT